MSDNEKYHWMVYSLCFQHTIPRKPLFVFRGSCEEARKLESRMQHMADMNPNVNTGRIISVEQIRFYDGMEAVDQAIEANKQYIRERHIGVCAEQMFLTS